MVWNPGHYLRFADHRTRPGLELLAGIPDQPVQRAVDLGAGTGHLTAELAERWPEASVAGIESSPEMLDRARRDHPDVSWTLADIAHWEPEDPVDLLFSNAALHWLDCHDELFPWLRSQLAPGGVLAVQMPDNWDAPTHRIPADVLDSGPYSDVARSALLRDRLLSPAEYRTLLQPARVDLWRTTYFQVLKGDDPVWDWVTGSVLAPVLAALEDVDRERFSDDCRTRYRDAYPTDANGETVLPFSRLFMVAST